MTKIILGGVDGRGIMVDTSRTGIELKTTQNSVSRLTTTGGKGQRLNQHKQLDELHSARNQGGDHDEECKQRTRSAVQVDFGRRRPGGEGDS